MKTSNKQQQDILKLISSKLEVDRDQLMDMISACLNSSSENRVQTMYDSIIKLATIEKAIEINRLFQIQVQQEFIDTHIERLKETKSHDASGFARDEDDELKK